MQNNRLLIFAAVLLASPAAAQPASRQHPEDHLEPERPAFCPHYDLLLHELLHEAYDTSVDVSLVALPSFVSEYAVGLRSLETAGAGAFKTARLGAPYHIFILAPQASIWTYESIAGGGESC